MATSSYQIPMMAVGLVLANGCESVGPGPEGETDIDELVDSWSALMIADEKYPRHEVMEYGYYYSYTRTIDATGEIEVYEDLTGYLDLFFEETIEYGGQEYSNNSADSMDLRAIKHDDGTYRIVLRSDYDVVKLDCRIEEPRLLCTDSFEAKWNFKRSE